MKLNQLLIFSLLMLVFPLSVTMSQVKDSLRHPQERRLTNIRQLTFGGENAEAYYSFDTQRFAFQSTRDTLACDQIFVMDSDGGSVQMVSSGIGRTTCAYFLPGDSLLLYSSTHHIDPKCPPRPDYSKGYVWPVYPAYDIFVSTLDGKLIRQLTANEGYDAEATVSPLGDRILFTSLREGDIDVYSMKLDGSDVTRLTNDIGYDGGAFYSWDAKKIVYRGYHPPDSAGISAYRNLLAQNLLRPSVMEIFVMDADGSNKRQLTNFGAASFAPFFHPDNDHIIFSSNLTDPTSRNFDLFMIRIDGSGLERITFDETFDGFPMFRRDGKELVFASNRNGKVRGETNIFIADWNP